MAIQTRNSALAVKEETTEGTPVKPSASGDYLALQTDFTMSAAFESLANDELKASIGASKPILGLESPTASYTAYIRHSGTEGQAPNFGKTLLKAGFGTERVAGAEYDVVSATTSTITVDSGEGVNFSKGDALLIKDATNGFRIRPVESVAGDVLTLGFEVPVAPAALTELGQSITYAPANEGHPTVSMWHYLGNGGAIQMLSGGRVTDLGMTIDAGQLISGAFSVEGIEYYFNPIEITTSNNKIDFDDGSGEINASITAQTYKDPKELSDAIATAMNGLTSDTVTVSYSSTTGTFTVASDGVTFELLFSTGANTAETIAGAIGFAVSDQTGATTYTGGSAIDLSSPQNPVFDDSDPLAAKNNEVMIGDAGDITCFEASSISFSMGTPKTDILSVCAASGKSGSIINERSVSVDVTALLNQYDSEKFSRFRENTETRFQFSFGTKVGGNWEAGKSGMIYMPSATISSFEISDEDGLVALNMTLTGFVNSTGDGEVFIAFV
jgi:hypothetical protein